MNKKESQENRINVIYGEQNLKDILTQMLEEIFIEEVQKNKDEKTYLS